ncbi:DUF4381 domain-containing protein [Rheinheimera sp. MMS21-TC3]|uniref:DUF4381 domain-containing protein n=1 Tax=Rheinheimera sp. MMS21-TC3 TaxID=3072790 RepID=UPI0028C37F7F|nr:DUF4381 domain-containing protein [Rheinheimera sp. MMS21-TC3]WNO60717.1 DUF4381 domain-containing protein [Rheinheimera sp. MMS21-TC3]
MADLNTVNNMLNTEMMNTNPALASLADIVEPEFTVYFGLAPIYWLLLICTIAALAFTIWKLIQRHRYWLAKRQAIAQLDKLQQQPDTANQINLLLKRVLQHYQPKHPALSANTEQWQLWLAKHLSLPLPNLNILLYSPAHSEAELNQFYVFAKQWLNQYQAQDDYELPVPAVMSPLAVMVNEKEQHHA